MAAVRANNMMFVDAIIKYARQYQQYDIVNYNGESVSNTPLSVAVLTFNPDMVQFLIENRADVNKKYLTEAIKTIDNVVDNLENKINNAVTRAARESLKGTYDKHVQMMKTIKTIIAEGNLRSHGGTKAGYVSTKVKITFTSNGTKVSRIVFVNSRGTKYVKHAGAMVLVSKLKNVVYQ